jgi:DNA-binding CsgD family transcriptional regulator
MNELGRLSATPEAPHAHAIPLICYMTGDTNRLDAAEAVIRKTKPRQQIPDYEYWSMAYHVALALTAILREDKEDALHFFAHLKRHPGVFAPDGPYGISVDRLLGLLCVTLDRLDEAIDDFERAEAFCLRAELRPELAWTLRDHARALRQRRSSGDLERAEKLVIRAEALAREMDMRLLLSRMEEDVGRSRRASTRMAGLTQRQAEVLQLVARGLTNQEIAEELYISPDTVARHVHDILEKTGMANRAEATAFAFREGLVQ